MKQQNNNNTNRQSIRQSQHFKFNQYEEEDKGKLFGIFTVNNDKNSKKDLFGKWEDYVTLQSDQFSRIKESSELEELQIKAQNFAKIQQIAGNKQSKITDKKKFENKIQQKKEVKKQRFTEYQAAIKKQTISEPVISNMKIRESNSSNPPFDVPQISEIKKYDYSNNIRNSEKYLLDILQNNKKDFRKPPQQQRKNNSKQQEKTKAQKKNLQKNKSQLQQKQKQYKMSDKHYKNIIKKETNDHKNNQQISQKSKRVTIQDKGKIKFTTDSISGQFDHVLPEDLRYVPSTIKKIDHQILQEQQFKHANLQYQPMDIADPEKEIQQKPPYTKQINENTNTSNKANVKKVKYLNEKRKPVERINDKSQSQKHNSNNQIKNKSKSQDNKKHSKTIKPQKITIKSQKKQKLQMIEEQKRKLTKNSDMIIIQTVSSANSVQSNTNRPKRNRTAKLKYWQNQKIIYNKQGICVGKSITNPDLFLQILGFTQRDKINTNNNVKFGQSKISISLNLKPLQKIYSTGINYTIFQQQLKNAHQYKKILIKYSNSKDFRLKYLQFIIQDSLKKSGQQSYIIDQQQTFSLQNTSDTHSINVDIILYKP